MRKSGGGMLGYGRGGASACTRVRLRKRNRVPMVGGGRHPEGGRPEEDLPAVASSS